MDSDQDIATEAPPQEDNGGEQPPEKVLSQPDRDKLAGIVQKMKDNGETDDNIRTAVSGFKQKYGQATPSQPPAPSQGGPTPRQTKTVVKDIRTATAGPVAPETSKNPNVKPFAAWEKTINDDIGTQGMLKYAEAGTSPQQSAMGFAPVTSALPADQNQSVQLQQNLPNLRQQSSAIKKELTAQEVTNRGTVNDIVSGMAATPEKYYDKDGQLDYGKLLSAAQDASRQYGGDRQVAERIYGQAANTLQFQHVKPDVDKEFARLTGASPTDYLGQHTEAAGLMAHLQSDYTGEVAHSQQIISDQANDIFKTKYQPQLQHLAEMFGPQSEQYQQGLQAAQQSYAGDLRTIQTQENQRLVRQRGALTRQAQSALEDIQDKNRDKIDQYNNLYNQAYQNVLQNKERGKMAKTAMTETLPEGQGELFFKSLLSGLNSWAATRGAGLVAAGFNNPLTDWMRSRQSAAEQNDTGDLDLGQNLSNPATYITRAGKMLGSMAPDLAATAVSKNPIFSGLEFTASSTLSGMGDVYDQAKRDGYSESEAQQKAQEFAHANFITTLPANMLMSSAITANLRGAGGFATNLLKESAGGLGASLPQQYLEQSEGAEAKTLGQWLQEDAPKSSVEALVALAAGAPIMRTIGHLTQGMAAAKINTTQQQLYSDIIDKQGPSAASATAEMQYLNGALDEDGLTKAKQQIADLVNTKAGLAQLGVHPDYQKLFLQEQSDIRGLRQQADATQDLTMKKLLEGRIKEREGAVQDMVAGKTPYLKFSTRTGTDFVVSADAAEKVLAEPGLQRDLASGQLRAQAFGDEKDVAGLTQRINELAASGPNAEDVSEAPVKPQITEVRHGETQEDQDGLVSGADGVPLNDVGIKGVQDMIDDAKTRGFTKIVNPDTMRGNMTGEMVANNLGVPRETIPGFNSWDVGEWNGASDEAYNKAEHFFVNNPDATEFEGKTINESFNQYKDRIIKARQELEDKNQGNTLLVNHSSNINIWDAYQKSGGVWDAAAKQHYLTADDAEPAVLPPTPEQEKVAAEAEGGKSDGDIAQHVQQELLADNPNFRGRTPDLAGFYEKFKEEIGSVKDSSFDFRVNIPDLTQAQREGAVKDIEAEKVTARSTKLLDALQAMHEGGTIDYTRGRGDHVEKMGIPVAEFDRVGEEVAKEAEGWKKAPQHILDLFDEELKNLDNEKTNEPAGPVLGGGEAKAGDRNDDAASGRSQKAAADKERLPENGETKGREAATEGTGGKPLPERFGSRDEFERALKAAVLQPADRLTADKVDVNGKSNTVDQYKTKAEAVLKQLFPDHSIRWYDSEADYREKENRPEGSAGVYDPKGKYIAFNLERIRENGAENTIFHEVIHPIVQEALQSRPGAVDDAYSKLVDLKDIPGMDAVWRHEDQYRNRGLDTMKVEAITEFLTHVADGKIDPDHFNPSIKTRIIDAINKVFKALGINKVISTAQDIGKLASTIKDAFDQADAAPIKEALGNRGDASGEKMDAMRGVDDPVRKIVQRAPASMSDDDIRDAVMKSHGWDKARAEGMVKSVREEQTKGARQLVDEALAKGKQVAAGAAKLQTAPSSPFIAKMSRWFMDKIDPVADTKSIIRQNKGAEEFELDRVWHQSQKLLKDWNNVPRADRLAFILGMERPDLRQGWTQKQSDMADQYRKRLDNIYNQLKNALPHLNFIEDYFPHFWDKPDEVKNAFASSIAKTPMEGSKAFTKERIFGNILDGLEKNYTLSTDNPEELVRLAEANAWKFISAKNIFSDMKDMGYLKYSTDKSLPSDWKAVDDKLFNRIGAYVDKDGEAGLTMGSYMMPPDVARLVNDYLSPGLKGPVKDMIQNWNNLKNAFQLGVGAFHYATTSLESIASGMVRGVQLMSTLNPKNMLAGAGHIAGAATLFPNIALDLRRGWKAAGEWNKGLVTNDVQSGMDANARVGKQRMYSLEAKYNMQKAFGLLRADKDFGQIPKVLWNGLLYAPEMMNKFLMEKWVPGLKFGGYLRSMDAELAARKNMSPAEIQRAKEKTWDSMDDRLGQVVYDNRFINKTVKDLGFMSVRSLGWTGGTISAITKGIGEIPLSLKRAVKREGITQNTAYLLALPMMAGLYGAYYHYLHTGQAPKTAEDYFFPKDGTQNPDGTDHRTALPTYLKDILAYSKSPATTLLHKTAPLVSDVTDVYNNKDFYGEQVYGPEDNIFQKGVDVLKHQAEGMVPFSLRGRPGDNKTGRQGAEQIFGMMPAPKERERSPLQNKIMQAVGEDMSDRAKTHDEMEQMAAKNQLRQYLHDGGTWDDASNELKIKARVSDNAQTRFIEDSQLDPYERHFKSLKHDKKIELWQSMTDDEKEKYRQYMPEDYDTQ